MFRRWLSNFFKNNKEKIIKFIKIFGTLLLVGIAFAYSFGSIIDKNNSENENVETTVYRPSETVISGSNIEKEDYKKEENLVKTFVDYCNNKKIEEAYNLLTDECKQKMYPNIETFEKNYYDVIFTQKRECNLQSWISEDNYNTYKVTFIQDIMATGSYDNVEKFEDYITIVAKDNEQKINVNSYIKSKEINKTTKIEDLEVVAKSVDIYMNSIKYYLEVSNSSQNTILLDNNLNNSMNIKLIGSNNAEYKIDNVNLSLVDLVIYKNTQNKKIELKFKKQYGSSVEGKEIKFKKTIFNREEYLKDIDNYNNYEEVTIELY